MERKKEREWKWKDGTGEKIPEMNFWLRSWASYLIGRIQFLHKNINVRKIYSAAQRKPSNASCFIFFRLLLDDGWLWQSVTTVTVKQVFSFGFFDTQTLILQSIIRLQSETLSSENWLGLGRHCGARCVEVDVVQNDLYSLAAVSLELVPTRDVARVGLGVAGTAERAFARHSAWVLAVTVHRSYMHTSAISQICPDY